MYQVRVAFLNEFARLVEELGGDPEAILRQHGLSCEFIQNASIDTYMPYEQGETILQSAATMTGCAHFGMLLGKKSGIKLLGTVGYLMLQAKQISSALDILCQHFSYQVKEAAVLEWRIEDDYVVIAYRIAPSLKLVNQGAETAMANLLSFFHVVLGQRWYPAVVNFSHREPHNLRPYHYFFGSNVKFNQEENQFIFKRADLKRAMEKGEPALEEILQKHLEQFTLNTQTDLSSLVVSRIRQSLSLNKPTTIKHISAGLTMHPRKLRRMLDSEGTSFTQLLENTRQSIAMEKLQHSDISLVRLALYLGYSDASAFTRAFKRWTGITPNRWKLNNSNLSC